MGEAELKILYESDWDTSSVVYMSGMFILAGCNSTTFNLNDIGDWTVSSVTNNDCFNIGVPTKIIAPDWNI